MTNDDLVDELVGGGYLKTPLIIEAFRAIDRKDFVPEDLKDMAYVNEPLPIGYGQTISQPLTVAFMLELLGPEPDEKILDIGSGSGWQTAILGYISAKRILDIDDPVVHPKVMGIERIPELKEMAEKNIDKYNFVKRGIVEIILGDASKGVPKDLLPVYGFKKIIAAATAEEIPFIWKRQLEAGGKIVAPVKNSIVVFEKHAQDEFVKKEYQGFSFVPLVRD